MLDYHPDESAIVDDDTEVISFRVSPQHPHFFTSTSSKSKPAVTHAKDESTSPEDPEYDFILDFLNGLKPIAIRVQETNMPNPFAHPPTPPPRPAPALDRTPRTKVPSFATRRAACTHLTMERLYGESTCSICLRVSRLGWVYICTQDDLPESQITAGSVSEISPPPHQHVNGMGEKANGVSDPSVQAPVADEDPRFAWEDMLIPTSLLNPWVERAIKDGHYTPEQVVKLRAQKQNVVDTARAAIHQFEQIQTNNTYSPPQTPTTLQPLDSNPVINEEPSTNLPTANVALAQQAKARMFPFCTFRACQHCRPANRDRAWQRFDDIFSTEHEIPFIHYEEVDRPLASRSIMSTIGLRPTLILQRAPLRANDSRALYSRDEVGQIFFNNQNSTDSYRKSATPTVSSIDIADTDVEPESKGFRESMKRAFKSMLVNRRRSYREPPQRQRLRDNTDTTEEDPDEFDMGLWKELNDELLKLASRTPLPETESIEGLGKEVAVMDLGGLADVAVTEEAADLGTADVILSV